MTGTKGMAAMRFLFCVALIPLAGPALACNDMLHALAAERPVWPPAEIVEVSETMSSEGGEWMVWRLPDGPVSTVMRVDYGEMGALEHRLVVASPEAYAVRVTRTLYSAPIYVEGSTAIREETDIYTFCDGALLTPEDDMGPGPDYAAQAARALAMFDAPEIASHMPELAR